MKNVRKGRIQDAIRPSRSKPIPNTVEHSMFFKNILVLWTMNPGLSSCAGKSAGQTGTVRFTVPEWSFACLEFHVRDTVLGAMNLG